MADTGNMKLIREALVELVQFTCNSCQERLCESDCEEGGAPVPCSAILKARDALAEPPRECDRFADEKWADALHAAFIEYCNGCDCPMGCDHRKNPRFLLDGNCASILKCFARFALSKATPKEGGAK